MTQHHPDHSTQTNFLAACVARSCSWLGHRDLGGQLDWALLHGATAHELHAIRPSWPQHVTHLRRDHGVTVVEEPAGVFRIVGAGQPAAEAALQDALTPACSVDEMDEAAEDVADPRDAAAPDTPDVRFMHTARALMALHHAGELANPLHLASVGMLVRQASECRHWHNSTHYRSLAAAEKIAQAAVPITTVSQYQAFCRRELRHEHMVPNNVLYKMIVANPAPTEAWFMDLFERYSKRATITREEDALLRRFDMPPGFSQPGHEWHEDAFARYRETGLFDRLVPRAAGASWFTP